MATWCSGVRAAQHLMEGVEECLQGYGYYFHVTLYPFRSNGGRSNGVSAIFEYDYPKQDKERKLVCITLFEHWNTDNLCVKVDRWVPTNVPTTEGHDEPNAEFRCDSMQTQTVAYAIQSFLLQYFDLPYPKEWDVPKGFRGTGTFEDEGRMDVADDIMMPTIVDWCDPPEERENG
ncbi:MAG: hypothetical protein ACWGQW_06880 [bacterium]